MANFDGGVNYGRNYRLEFHPLNDGESISFGQRGKLTAKDYTPGLAVDFNITKTAPPLSLPSTDKADITIYNIKPDTSRAIQRPGLFKLLLGHGSDLSLVFQGQKTTTATGIVGNDTFLNIPMVAGSYISKDRYFSNTYNRGATKVQIGNDLINHIQSKFKFPVHAVIGLNEFNSKDDKVYTEPTTVRGDALKLLAELLPNYFIFVTDSNTVNIMRRHIFNSGPLLAGPSLKWSPRYGQVDYIKYISSSSEDAETVQTGIETRGILSPSIKVGTIMNVDTSQQRGINVADTIAAQLSPSLIQVPESFICRVTSVRHFGNTYTGDFLTEWAGDYVETDALPQN